MRGNSMVNKEKAEVEEQRQHEMRDDCKNMQAGKPKNGDDNDDQIAAAAPMPLMALNHISRLCRSVETSVGFYVKVLGFVLINRPPSLHFKGAWLFNYGVGIHLVQKNDGGHLPDASPDHLDPMDNHISFQCDNMDAMEQRLKEMNIKYIKRTINEEEGLPIDQLFFNDPDGFMIEICNCENLELVPVGDLGRIRLPRNRHNPPLDITG